MKKLLLGSLALATLAAVGPVAAADLKPAPVYTKAPMMAPVYSWTGCYIGVEGGGAWGRSRHEDAFGVPITGDYDVTGALIGGELGCNYQPAGSSWLIGLEGDWSWVTKKGSANDIPPFNTGFVSGTKENWLATGRARVGFLVTPQFLLYGTGGFAVAAVEANVTPPGFATFTETKDRWGWTAGGGGEYAFTSNWSVKAEYLFVRLQNASYFATPVATGGGTIVSRGNVPLNNNILRGGLNYKF
ncbi:MAG TPA: outer membrane beta-barrel protein [Xanthobacteraceae bacterium]